MELRYLYLGSDDTESDVTTWLAVPGTRLRWRFRHFGADVAAIDPGSYPILLIADHRPAGSVLPIYAVADLDVARARLQAGGWSVELEPMGTPEGPACVMKAPSATIIAVLQLDHPDAMDGAYADEANTHRVIP
ncbi:MAG TPA: hypothetical protein VFC03_22140 [Acidimicrobiales bacterium]|nr:hypothetical protein [Acidimicrobiales bacterium]